MDISTIEESVSALEELISGSGKNMMDQIGRSSRGELFILKYLYEKKSSVIPSEISEAMHASTARISAALNSLEKKNQIHRDIDTNNRRNILVTITEEGKERSHSDILHIREKIVSIFTEMGEDEAAEFVRLIKCFFETSDRILQNEQHEFFCDKNKTNNIV